MHRMMFYLFLTAQVAKEKELAAEEIATQLTENELLARNWTGEVPYLHLIHCVVYHDNIKDAFLNRNDLLGDRMELENQNSSER